MIHDTKNVGKPTVLTCRFPTFYGCLLHMLFQLTKHSAKPSSKTVETDTEVELVNSKLEPTGRSTGDEAIVLWKLTAENIKKKSPSSIVKILKLRSGVEFNKEKLLDTLKFLDKKSPSFILVEDGKLTGGIKDRHFDILSKLRKKIFRSIRLLN